MKSALKTVWTAAVRIWLLFQIRSLEITIDGQAEVLECVRDPLLHGRINLARSAARRELARVRADYNATLPPGKRVVWRLA